jgi:hypothetical protein
MGLIDEKPRGVGGVGFQLGLMVLCPSPVIENVNVKYSLANSLNSNVQGLSRKLAQQIIHVMTLNVLGIQNGGSRSNVDHEESYKQLDEMEQEKKKLGTVKF